MLFAVKKSSTPSPARNNDRSLNTIKYSRILFIKLPNKVYVFSKASTARLVKKDLSEHEYEYYFPDTCKIAKSKCLAKSHEFT